MSLRRLGVLALHLGLAAGFAPPLRPLRLCSAPLAAVSSARETRRAALELGWGLLGLLGAADVAVARTIPDAVSGEAGRLQDLVPIAGLDSTVQRVAQLVAQGDATALNEALALLNKTPAVGSRKAFDALFDVYSERVSAKTRAMNAAAFVTYYEETRYKDVRLEDEAPTRQALQYQHRNEAYIALDNLQAELAYLAKETGPLDVGDAQGYAKDATAAMKEYLALAPAEDVRQARERLR